MRIMMWDIEATSLNASYGRAICMCFKGVGEKRVISLEAHKMAEEPEMLAQLGEVWDDLDAVVTWNGLLYDKRFIAARRLYYGMTPLPKKFHLDLLWIHKQHFKTGSHRLDSVLQELGCRTQKHHVPATEWSKASEPTHPESSRAFAQIVKHCQHDVISLEEVYHKLLPYVQTWSRR